MNGADALNFARKSLELRQQLKNNHNDLIESYIHEGSVYNILGAFDKSYDKLLKASELLKSYPNKKHQIEYNLQLAALYHSKKDYIQAEENMLKHIKEFQEENGDNHALLIDRYVSLGLIYKEMINYDKALEIYHKGLSLNEKINGKDHKITAIILENIGEIHRIKINFEEALSFLNESYRIKVKLFGLTSILLQSSYYYLAMVYNDMNDLTNAYIQCHKRLELLIATLGHDTNPVAGCYDFLGHICVKAKDKAKALENLQKSRSIFVKLKDKSQIAFTDNKVQAIMQSLD